MTASWQRDADAGTVHPQTLITASNLTASLVNLGESAEAATLLWTTLTVRTSTVGSDDRGTLSITISMGP